MHSSEVRLSFG